MIGDLSNFWSGVDKKLSKTDFYIKEMKALADKMGKSMKSDSNHSISIIEITLIVVVALIIIIIIILFIHFKKFKTRIRKDFRYKVENTDGIELENVIMAKSENEYRAETL